MFGFKMSKDDKDLPKVREGHFEYINSGQFLKDALKDPETITEVAWFVKNKDVIINALQNRGKQTAKKELLNNIGAHSTSDSNNFYAQSDDDNQEFDPKKFIE